MILQYDKKFHGEFESIKAIQETNTVLTPLPIVLGHTEDMSQNFIVLDYMNRTKMGYECMRKLGNQLADMHLCNFQEKCSLVY